MNIRVVNLSPTLCCALGLPSIVCDRDFMVYIEGWQGFCHKEDLQKCIMIGLKRNK